MKDVLDTRASRESLASPMCIVRRSGMAGAWFPGRGGGLIGLDWAKEQVVGGYSMLAVSPTMND